MNDAEGKEVPLQVEDGKILFLASAPSAKAVASDEFILRMVELDGKMHRTCTFLLRARLLLHAK